MSLEAADFADCRSFREVVCRLFEAWARQEKKRRWGDKTPHYVTEMPVLLELFPKAKAMASAMTSNPFRIDGSPTERIR